MAQQAKFYHIRTLTNLHVGSGDNNYGVVDNLVQRDVNTGLPTIHSSSLKGALREFFRTSDKSRIAADEDESPLIKHIFGYVGKEKPGKGDGNEKSEQSSHPGNWQFLSADLLSRPVRSDKVPYVHATSSELIASLISKLTAFDLDVPRELNDLALHKPEPGNPLVFDRSLQDATIEDLDWNRAACHESAFSTSAWLKEVLGEHLVLLHHSDLCDIELPVIARNYLVSGESKNLWYEEVVPYDARFGVFILQDAEHNQAFETALQENHVQIGANASIGYGLCQLRQPQSAEKESTPQMAAV